MPLPPDLTDMAASYTLRGPICGSLLRLRALRTIGVIALFTTLPPDLADMAASYTLRGPICGSLLHLRALRSWIYCAFPRAWRTFSSGFALSLPPDLTDMAASYTLRSLNIG